MPVPSDPAIELHNMCVHLSRTGSKERTADALAKVFDLETGSQDYFVMLGAIAARFARLSELFDRLLEEPLRALGKSTITGLATFLQPAYQQAEWQQVATQCFTQQHLQTLMMSSAFLRRVAPIHVPTPDERKQASEQLGEAIAGLEGYEGAVTASIRTSLIAAKGILDRFNLYGVDALTEQLLQALLYRTVSDAEPDVPAAERKARSSAWAVVAMAFTLLVGSDSALTAVENYQARAQHVMQVLMGEQKQLPPPSAPDDFPTPATLPDEPQHSRRQRPSK